MSEHNQVAHRQRMLADQILDRIAREPAFHQQLLHNTAQALQTAGFAAELEAEAVVGYDVSSRSKCLMTHVLPDCCKCTCHTSPAPPPPPPPIKG